MTPILRTASHGGDKLALPVGTQQTGAARRHVDRRYFPVVARTAARARSLDQVAALRLRPFTLPALRILLGMVFIWFGGLKVIGRSPVTALVAQTLPFGNHRLVMTVLGSTELLLGALLICGIYVRSALPVLAIHLAGTFSTFVVAPNLMFSSGDPLLLTATGEFVLKNVVLIGATLVLISHTSRHDKIAEPASGSAPPTVDADV